MTTGGIELVRVGEDILSALVTLATEDARPNEVTPPLSPGDEWTPERAEWLRSFHRDRRGGLLGAAGEATWAIVLDGRVVGAARLKQTERLGCLETGVWVGRSIRGRGVGRHAMAALIQEAASAGADELCADTTQDNSGSLAVLRQFGFQLSELDAAQPVPPGRAGGHAIRACLPLSSASGDAARNLGSP